MAPRWTLPLLLASAASATILAEISAEEPKPNLHARLLRNASGSCEILSFQAGETYRLLESDTDLKIESRRQIIDREKEHTHDGDVDGPVDEIFDLWSKNMKVIQDTIQYTCPNGVNENLVDDDVQVYDTDEVRQIVSSGDPLNRIDVVFMGDGYTLAEKNKFFEDMTRLTQDMFVDVTFKSYLPLFNIWAVFRESTQSGIGVGGKALSGAAFGLYRDGTELRGIYCSKASAARAACKLTGTGACDFPSLIGNDDYYGGLGGEFTISTRSPTSGTIVLRHEMGHNFGNVGEEYDGGSVYSGANAASSLSSVSWSHWLTQSIREETQVLSVQTYAWYDLAKGAYQIKFTSAGTYASWELKLSASGVDEAGSFIVTLDGVQLPWTTPGLLDRTFFTWTGTSGLSKGSHVLEFKSGFAPAPGKPIRQLCSVTLHEYAKDFLFDDSIVGAYPTFSTTGKKTYRPNNEYCLMRNMSSPHFCQPCKENMFLRFFATVNLIDDLSAQVYCDTRQSGVARTTLRVSAVPLAHFRPANQRIAGESYTLRWSKDGKEVPEYDDIYELDLGYETTVGTWSAKLSFKSLEIRKDSSNVSVATKSVKVASGLNKC